VAEEKDINKAVDDLAAAKEKYLSANTVISIGGYSFTPAKLMIAGGIISSVLGGLYGAFEVYKGYQDMKEKIAKYVAPDLSEFDKRLTVIEKNQAETSNTLKDSASKTADYTRDIKNDLKADIRKIEKVVDDVERSNKQMQRDVDKDVRELRREIDRKIKEALDNPLANK